MRSDQDSLSVTINVSDVEPHVVQSQNTFRIISSLLVRLPAACAIYFRIVLHVD